MVHKVEWKRFDLYGPRVQSLKWDCSADGEFGTLSSDILAHLLILRGPNEHLLPNLQSIEWTTVDVATTLQLLPFATPSLQRLRLWAGGEGPWKQVH